MSDPLTLVPMGQHTADDLEALLPADDAQPLIERLSLVHVNHALHNGKMFLFRLNPGPGVLLTELFEDNGIRRLQILRGSGNFGLSVGRVMRQLWKIAQELGCECVTTVVYSDRLQEVLETHGAEVEGWIMRYSGER